MEDQCGPLTWPFFYQDEGIEELKHYLLHTTLELETTILSTQEELVRKDDEIVHLKSLLTKVSEERDDALAKCQTLMLEKLLLQQQLEQQQQPSSGTTSIEGESRRAESNIVHSSSDSDESFVASPCNDNKCPNLHGQQIPLWSSKITPNLPVHQKPCDNTGAHDVTETTVVKKPLPEKGKFLQAVMEAGPLLQTLLLAGPLPQWEHPPPQLNTIDIPPVTISSPSPSSGYFSKKRALDNGGCFDMSPNSKYQRVVHQSSLTII